MSHPLDDSEPARRLDSLVIRQSVENALDMFDFSDGGDCSWKDKDLGLVVGMDVHNGAVCYSASRFLSDGTMKIVDYGRFLAPSK
jgi:hypothetical protein